jgi:hypothetical protein
VLVSNVRLIFVGLLSLGIAVWSDFTTAQDASVSDITYIGLSEAGDFQHPPDVITTPSLIHMAMTNPVAQGARGVRGDRDLAQTFTVSSTDFPSGVNVKGFAIYYEGGPITALGSFNVELFPVADTLASPLADSPSVSESLIVSATGLNFETGTPSGTAVFNFDNIVHLNPGGYAWRFFIPGAGMTNLFAWGPTSSANPYAAGVKFEGDADAAGQPAQLGDFSFGFIDGSIPGDFNSDGTVDGLDFVTWQTNFPTASDATKTQGDADGDGDVDGADFVVWQTNFPSPSPGVSPVPEPPADYLFVCGLIGLAWCIRAGRWNRRVMPLWAIRR